MRALVLVLALLVGAIAGGTIVGIWLSGMRDLGADDWLQFGSAAAGVLLTVLLTLAVEEYRQRTANARALQQMLRAARNVRQAAAATKPIEHDPRSLEERVAAATTAQWSLKRSIGQFLYAATRIEADDIQVWQAVEDAKDMISQNNDVLQSELRILHGNVTDQVFAINQEKVETPARYIEFSMLALAETVRKSR